MTGAEALRHGVARLATAGVDDPARDARRILAYALEIAPARLTVVLPDPVDGAAAARFEAGVAARCRFQPVSQITGTREFWGRAFRVTPDVLDPRPETEILIVAALEGPAKKVLDIGTGTGCILLTLLKEWPAAQGVATDLSAAALAVARQNADDLGLSSRVQFRQGDWCAGAEGPFDLIVSNPPYIAEAEMAGLAPDVRHWEPRMALTPGGDGLDAYRAILPMAAARLTPGGRVLLEIGPTQAEAVLALARAAGFGSGDIRRDFDGRDRCVVLTRS
ncbi:MAG: peptide chain release factor N(5)-glutamine methyltransferase [Qingshengfaniella sp.]